MKRNPMGLQTSRKDLAKVAGVSVTTVTHALSNTPGARVSRKTVEKIKRIARELNYSPNFVGKALVTGKNYLVGLLQPSQSSIFSSFYQQIMYGLVQEMTPDDYNLVILFRDDEGHWRKPLEQSRLDGLFILQSEFDESAIQTALTYGLPLAVINKEFICPSGKRIACIHSDHDALVDRIIDDFVDSGVRSILSVLDNRLSDPNARLFDAYTRKTNALATKGIMATNLVPDPMAFQSQVRNIFGSGQHWDAIYVDGYLFSSIVIDEARRNGLQPGIDFKLTVSVTSERQWTLQEENVTVYTQQPYEVGRKAWQVMQEMVKTGHAPESHEHKAAYTPISGRT